MMQDLKELFAPHKTDSLRSLAWKQFCEMGLPERKDTFQYLSLSSLYEGAFVEGQPILGIKGLPKEAVILPLSEAKRSYGTFLQNRLTKSFKEEKDPFALLNGALHDGIFVYIPPNVQCVEPVECTYLFEGEKEQVVFPRVQVFIGASSEVQWVSKTKSTSCVCVNSVMDIALEENASFHHTYFLEGDARAWHFDSFRATLKKNSRLKNISFNKGAKSARQDYRIFLNGENSEADLKGLWVLSDQRQSHVNVYMEHAAPHAQSMQHFKGINKDRSLSSFEGKIFVRPEAQKTQAYQLNNNMVLGDRAIANSKPNLEIYADDVKASHGSTTAEIDRTELLYLQTRGISEEEAKMLLMLGFCKEIVDNIPFSQLREEIYRLL